MERRIELGHPLGAVSPRALSEPGQADLTAYSAVADLTIELGCEELPPADIHSACQQLRFAPSDVHREVELASSKTLKARNELNKAASLDAGMKPPHY